MSSPLKNILLIGAGGHLGPSILSALHADPHFNLSILARKSSSSTFPSDIPVHRISNDYPEEELAAAFKDKDAVVSTIATANAGQQRKFADVAARAGVRRFVPSEFGSDTLNEKAMAILPQYFAGKRSSVEYLQTKEKEGLSWTAFVTGPFFELAMAGFMGFDIAARKATIFGSGRDVWSTTTMPGIGLAVAAALKKPAETANRYIYIDSFTISQNDVLAALEKLTGAKFEVERVDAEEQKKQGMEKMAAGDFSGAMSLIRYINCTGGHGGDYATYRETSNELLGLPKVGLEEALGKVLKGN